MKTLIPIILVICLLACKKETESLKTYSVKYEVITSKGRWFGEYIIESGIKVCTCTPTQLNLNASGWTYQFNVTKVPFTLHIDGTSEYADAANVTTNIYVDGKLVISKTNQWAAGVTSADYIIQ